MIRKFWTLSIILILCILNIVTYFSIVASIFWILTGTSWILKNAFIRAAKSFAQSINQIVYNALLLQNVEPRTFRTKHVFKRGWGVSSALLKHIVELFKAILSYQSWAASPTPSWSHPPWFVGCTPVGPIKVWNTSFLIPSHPIFPSVRVKHLVEKIDKVQDLRNNRWAIKYLEPTDFKIFRIFKI